MSDEQTMNVRLVGGPADWTGRTVPMPASGEPGAYLISSHTPPRDAETEDIDPRAVYLPAEGGQPDVWHFQGWFPASPADPTPEDYLEGRVPTPGGEELPPLPGTSGPGVVL